MKSIFFNTILAATIVTSLVLVPAKADTWPLYNPDHQSEVVAKGHGVVVALDLLHSCFGSRCTFAPPSFTFNVDSVVPGLVSQFTIARNTNQVDAIVISSARRVAIVGQVAGLIHSITVIDLKNGHSLYNYFCFTPSFSPNGRYVAFNRFFPGHAPREQTSSVVLVDDLAGLSPKWTVANGRTRQLSDIIPVYPTNNLITGSTSPGITIADVHRTIGLSWKNDSTFAFTDIWHGHYFRVTIRLPQPTGHPFELVSPTRPYDLVPTQ